MSPELGADTPGRAAALLSVVARELRAPLAALAASSERLAEELHALEPHEVRAMASAIHERSLGLEALVENLLCDVAIRQGRFSLRRQPINLVDVVQEIRPLVEPTLSRQGQRLRLRRTGPPIELDADARRLGQAVVNLLLNASKFGGPGTAIDLHVQRHGPRVRVTVADRGPGLPPGPVEALFEPFYRGALGPRAGTEGIGLGLAIVRAIVVAHGGQVGAAQRPGGGARFWFEVPGDGVRPHPPSEAAS